MLDPRRLGRWGLPVAAAAVALVAVSLTVVGTHSWLAPPPEFVDVTPNSGLDAPMHTWESHHGEPEGLLDVLPPASPALGDPNGDGYADAFVPMPGYTNESLAELRDPRSKLFLNDGSTRSDERFLDVTDVAGLDVPQHAYAASWTDADGDGWQDLFVGGYGFANLYANQGNMTFRDATETAGIPQEGLVLGGAFGDVDRDGDLDLFLVRFTHADAASQPEGGLLDQEGAANALLLNQGDGTFAPVADAAGIGAIERRSTSASIVDVDGDGRNDVYVTNYGQPATLWLNEGDGTFTEAADAAGLADGEQATCQAWSDVDRDTDLDLFVAHQEGVEDGLFLDQGDGTYERAEDVGLSATTRGTGWGCAASDFDNDADVDLFVAHSEATGEQAQRPIVLANQLYDEGVFRFEDVTDEAGDNDRTVEGQAGTLNESRAASGLAMHDVNVDLEAAADVVTTNHDVDRARLYRSWGFAGGWAGGNGDFLRVWLEADGANTPATGAQVTVEAGDLTLVKQAGASMSWGAQSATELVFGLSKSEEAGFERFKDLSLEVAWPDGSTDRYEDVWSPDASTLISQTDGYRNDTLAPRPSLSLVEGEAGERGWYTSNVTLQLTARDTFAANNIATGTASLAYSLDGETWHTVEDPALGVALSFDGNGTHPLWVRTVDEAGNEAVTVYPIRIDTDEPTGQLEAPLPGEVYAQGDKVAEDGTLAETGRSTVLAPSGSPLEDLGADHQPVRVTAGDATGGVHHVQYRVFRADTPGTPVMEADVVREPFTWRWPVQTLAAGEYLLEASVEDPAGHARVLETRVDVVPTTPAGWTATVEDGPSPVRPGNG